MPGSAALADPDGRVGSVVGLAAVADGGRVVVVPENFARLTATGRDVVITHELTHVATGATRGGRVPMWMSEGFADYVGYRDAGIAVRMVAAELAREVRAGACPPAFPGPAIRTRRAAAGAGLRGGVARLPSHRRALWREGAGEALR